MTNYNKHIKLRVTGKMLERIAKEADRRGVNRSEFVRFAIEKELPKIKKEEDNMKTFETYEEEVIADTDKDVVELALESGLFEVRVGWSEFSNLGLYEPNATDHFWGFADSFFGEVIERYCFELDVIKEAKQKENPEEFLKEEELYNRILELAEGKFNIEQATNELKDIINNSLDNCIILEKALRDFDHLEEEYIIKILEACNIDYEINKF